MKKKSKKTSLKRYRKKSKKKSRGKQKIIYFGFSSNEKHDNIVKNTQWVLYVRPKIDGKECPFCVEAENFLINNGEKNIKINTGDSLITTEEKTVMGKYEYWPKIFFYHNNECNFVGGFSDLKKKYKNLKK